MKTSFLVIALAFLVPQAQAGRPIEIRIHICIINNTTTDTKKHLVIGQVISPDRTKEIKRGQNTVSMNNPIWDSNSPPSRTILAGNFECKFDVVADKTYILTGDDKQYYLDGKACTNR